MAEITVTIPNSTFTVTQVSSGIEVTTPTAVVVEVSSDSNTIDVTNTQTNIAVTEVGITNTDQLIEGTTNLFFTNARADARVALGIAGIDFPVDSVNGQTQTVVLDTDDINEGTANLYYTTTRANNDFDARLATKTTTNLAEGTNLYYTTARSNSDFDTRLATKSTTDLAEGTNLYYTAARFNSAFAAKSTTDLTEGTNLYYTDTRFDTRLATKTTTDLAEGTNLYYTTVRANADFDTRLATKTTDNLNEGLTNQYFTTARARQAIQATDIGGDGSLSYDNSTGVITYTGPSAAEVRAHFSGGTGVTITDGVVAIGQSVGTADSVTFSSVNLDSRAVLDTGTLTTSDAAADQVVDSFDAAVYRTAKYTVSVSSGTEYHSFEILVNHNGTVANQTTYADLATGASLATFSADISSGSVRLLTTPTNAVTVYKVARTAIAV